MGMTDLDLTSARADNDERRDVGSDFRVCPAHVDMTSPVATSARDLRTLDIAALGEVADDLRRELIEVVAKTGGHLGSGLGVVELTVALHHVYDTPADKLIWDVSHQCYPHKLLTGRRTAMTRLRQAGGAAGFTTRTESAHDPFGAAHSSTSISAGFGFAVARDLAGDHHNIVSVIGDGAASGGLAFEGLNNLGASGRRMTIVLNDNNMSIAPPVGALSSHFDRLRVHMPARGVQRATARTAPLSSFVGGPTLFDLMGVAYCGPYDGHDLQVLVPVLAAARSADRPVLVHIVTEKGHGYAPAVGSADCYHGVGKFDVPTGRLDKPVTKAPSYTKVFAEALIGAADRDPRIVAITAAMPSGTGLDLFARRFPDRCFDVGIAEQHAVTFAAGLAAAGMVPFAAIYSTFLQRGYDQVVHDVAIQRLPVRFAIDRAGLVGADGVTHHGSYDIAFLGCLPGFVLMAPSDEGELQRMVATAIAIDDRPSALRYPRGEGLGVPLAADPAPLEIGRGRIVREGSDIAILSYGTCLARALAAADKLAESGIAVTVADARFAKPVDADLAVRLASNHAVVFTLEEGSSGGFATQVMQAVQQADERGVAAGRIRSLHLPDWFIEHGSQSEQEQWAGIDANGIAATVLQVVGRGRRTVYRNGRFGT